MVQDNFYAASNMVRDLRRGIFSETNSTKNVDLQRRNLQKYFIIRMKILMDDDVAKMTDISSIVRGELESLKYQVNIASKRAVNRITKYHYKDCYNKIDAILNPKK